jgi:dihydrodipicolinate synthase/N-acetylneuraminate lyase
MILPCSDPRDATGLAQGYREIADAAGTKLILYLKDELNFGNDKEAGLDVVARLVADGSCAGIKYAVVRDEPANDPYLEALLTRVDRRFVISGIGERPAVVHLRDWKLPGFTTGSGCIAPRLSRQLFAACGREDFEAAENLRSQFLPLEDLRDLYGPARVLHTAVAEAGISRTGKIPPFVSALNEEQQIKVARVAQELLARDAASEPRVIASGSISKLP